MTITVSDKLACLYYNGVLQGAIQNPGILPYDFGLAKSNHLGYWTGRYFTGQMEDVRIYQGAMTGTQVQALYTSTV